MRVERVGPWIIFVLSISFLFQAILSVWDDSPTFDETINPSVGYVELLTGDLSFVHDHPPLYRVFMALPLLAFQPSIPLEHDSWQKRQKGVQDRYDFAREFFYVANKDADRLLFWSRLPVVFLSLLLGLLVFQWAKELYGNHAGLFALFLYSFEPNIIAHSRLAINDLVLALFVFSTSYQFWQYHNAPSLGSLILTGISLGLALVSKFSAVVLVPILFLLSLLRAHRADNLHDDRSTSAAERMRNTAVRLGESLKTMLFISVVAVCVVGLLYGSQWGLYIKGFYDTILHYQGGHPAFLLGEYSQNGWWYYFIIAFLFKTPIPLLIYFFVAFLFLSFRKGRAEYFLLVPVGVIMASALMSHINIGIRHILAIHPFLIVLVSSITTIRFSRPRFFLSCLGGLALWYLFSTLSIFPSYLAYFNEFIGPQNAYRALADSNLDWGQDLKRLKMFMDRNGIKGIYLSYFGTADPCYYGIKLLYLPWSFFEPRCAQKDDGTKVDFVAISATNLQAVYFSDKGSFEWLKDYEPIARIGYSIFVYDIREDASAHNNLGILYLKYRMVEEALKEFKRVVEMVPQEAMAHANLGFAYALLSLFDQAEEAYKKALELDPENSIAKAGLKGVRRIAGKLY